MKGEFHARAGRQKPARRQLSPSGERAHGPQHQVKPAASTHEQSGGRAAHVTAKATSIGGVPKPAIGSGGVEGGYPQRHRRSEPGAAGVGVTTFVPVMPLASSSLWTASSFDGCVPCVLSAKGATCGPARRTAGRVSTSNALAFIACAGPLPTRRNPSGWRLHNAVCRPITGKPCAGNRHARFERGP
jgi:hypothetical protein